MVCHFFAVHYPFHIRLRPGRFLKKKKLPEISEGMAFEGVQTKVTEHFTQPPKHFTEDSLLSAMVCGKGKYLHFPLRHRGKVSDRNLHCGNDRMVVCHTPA